MKNHWMTGLVACACGIMALTSSATPLNVVATTPELGSIASAVGGDRVQVRTITSGREDPHFLQARPTFTVMARDADLWIRMGMDLEVGWEPILLESSRNARIRVGQPGHFDGAAYIAYALEVPDATATRAMGDVHPAGNPHYMLDPLNARLIANAMAARLSRLDPEGTAEYQENLNRFLQRLDTAMFGSDTVQTIGADTLWDAIQRHALDEILETAQAANQLSGWAAAMRPYQGKPILTFHKSWSYLAHRFGFLIAAELEPLPGVPPSPAHLARVVDIARSQDVSLLLKEPFYPSRPANLVARQSDVRVVTISSYATDASPDGYFNWMHEVIAAFQK